jgi:hypothetical protein
MKKMAKNQKKIKIKLPCTKNNYEQKNRTEIIVIDTNLGVLMRKTSFSYSAVHDDHSILAVVEDTLSLLRRRF